MFHENGYSSDDVLPCPIVTPAEPAAAPAGQHVVPASDDKTARVWLLSDGSLVHTLEGLCCERMTMRV